MKEAVKLHMVCISANNDRHPIPKTFTPLHYKPFTPLHCNLHSTSLHLHSISL